MAYGSSQTRGHIRATAAGLQHSHSNARSEPHLRPTPQLTAMPDPQCWTRRVRPGIEPSTSWFLVRFVSAAPPRELLKSTTLLMKCIYTEQGIKAAILWFLVRFVSAAPQRELQNAGFYFSKTSYSCLSLYLVFGSTLLF